MTTLDNLDKLIEDAVKYFWDTRRNQKQKATSKSDAQSLGRAAVTGGKQMAAFEELTVRIAREKGISENCIFHSKALELPGYFRPEKKWDILIIDEQVLVAAMEFKSQVGSFGKNFNNRAEEAIGSANDLWIAYREGAFGDRIKPWLGYLFLLEEHPKSTSSIKLKEPHFETFAEFHDRTYTPKNKMGVSYAKRYEILLTKLIRERHYDAGCLLLSKLANPPSVTQPCNLLSAKRFFIQLAGHLETHVKSK